MLQVEPEVSVALKSLISFDTGSGYVTKRWRIDAFQLDVANLQKSPAVANGVQ